MSTPAQATRDKAQRAAAVASLHGWPSTPAPTCADLDRDARQHSRSLADLLGVPPLDDRGRRRARAARRPTPSPTSPGPPAPASGARPASGSWRGPRARTASADDLQPVDARATAVPRELAELEPALRPRAEAVDARRGARRATSRCSAAGPAPRGPPSPSRPSSSRPSRPCRGDLSAAARPGDAGRDPRAPARRAWPPRSPSSSRSAQLPRVRLRRPPLPGLPRAGRARRGGRARGPPRGRRPRGRRRGPRPAGARPRDAARHRARRGRRLRRAPPGRGGDARSPASSAPAARQPRSTRTRPGSPSSEAEQHALARERTALDGRAHRLRHRAAVLTARIDSLATSRRSRPRRRPADADLDALTSLHQQVEALAAAPRRRRRRPRARPRHRDQHAGGRRRARCQGRLRLVRLGRRSLARRVRHRRAPAADRPPRARGRPGQRAARRRGPAPLRRADPPDLEALAQAHHRAQEHAACPPARHDGLRDRGRRLRGLADEVDGRARRLGSPCAPTSTWSPTLAALVEGKHPDNRLPDAPVRLRPRPPARPGRRGGQPPAVDDERPALLPRPHRPARRRGDARRAQPAGPRRLDRRQPRPGDPVGRRDVRGVPRARARPRRRDHRRGRRHRPRHPVRRRGLRLARRRDPRGRHGHPRHPARRRSRGRRGEPRARAPDPHPDPAARAPGPPRQPHHPRASVRPRGRAAPIGRSDRFVP